MTTGSNSRSKGRAAVRWGRRSNRRLQFSAGHGTKKKSLIIFFKLKKLYVEYNEAFAKQANKPKPVLFLSSSFGNQNLLVLYHWLDQNHHDSWKYGTGSETWFVSAGLWRRKPWCLFFGCQGLLFRQWGDTSCRGMSYLGGPHTYSRFM